eukprot:362135-Chlamydomonas_euryale.AAC.5
MIPLLPTSCVVVDEAHSGPCRLSGAAELRTRGPQGRDAPRQPQAPLRPHLTRRLRRRLAHSVASQTRPARCGSGRRPGATKCDTGVALSADALPPKFLEKAVLTL